MGNMSSKDTGTGTVKGTDPDVPGTCPHHPVNPFPHFSSSFIGKSYRENACRSNPFTINHIGYPVDNDPGFTTAGTGKNKQWTLTVFYRITLSWIQAGKQRIRVMFRFFKTYFSHYYFQMRFFKE